MWLQLGNTEYREELARSGENGLYGYDGIYRMDDFERGRLNSDKTEINSPPRTQVCYLHLASE